MTPLDTIELLTPEQVTVVANAAGDSEGTQVREAAGFRWLVNGGDSVQTLMSVDSPATLLLPNHIAMLFGLLLVDEVESILSLGMGGGSFERFLHKHFPHCSISSVETNQEIIGLAREYFGVPESVQIVSSTAEDFVRTTGQRFNLILCDIFEQEKHPACLISKSFYREAKSTLRPEGVLAMNTTPESDQELLNILQALRGSFSVVYLATINDRGNVIVIAKNGDTQSIDTIRSRAEVISTRADVSLAQWVDMFRLIPDQQQR